MTALTLNSAESAACGNLPMTSATEVHRASNLHLWIFEIPCALPDPFSDLEAEFSSLELERSRRYRDDQRRRRFLHSVRGVRCILSEYLRLAPRHVPLSRDKQGAPRVLDRCGCELLSLSISHSANWTALLVGPPGRALGVDIEPADASIDPWALARIALSREEQLQFAALQECEQRRALLQIWTAKESVVKALGVGFRLPMASVSVDFCNGSVSGIHIPGRKHLKIRFRTLHTIRRSGEQSRPSCVSGCPSTLLGTIVQLENLDQSDPTIIDHDVGFGLPTVLETEISNKLHTIGLQIVSPEHGTSVG